MLLSFSFPVLKVLITVLSGLPEDCYSWFVNFAPLAKYILLITIVGVLHLAIQWQYVTSFQQKSEEGSQMPL